MYQVFNSDIVACIYAVYNIESNKNMNESKLKVIEYTGDLFDASLNTLIIHACNCQGSWSAGIAKEFQDRYPYAYADYVYRCENYKEQLLGKGYIILPINLSRVEYCNQIVSEAERKELNSRKHFIGCLFTSYFYGRLKSSPSDILANTLSSMEDLLQQIYKWNIKVDEVNKINEMRMCKINSGLFNVPWNKTKEILESISVTKNNINYIKVVDLK